MLAAIILALVPLAGADGAASAASSCTSLKSAFRSSGCCGMPGKSSNFQVVPMPETMFTDNYCHGKKPTAAYFNNINCTMENGVVQALEQAGANITSGYVGGFDTGSRQPITSSYLAAGLCPVNVHWHVGTEHYSAGQFDGHGSGPGETSEHRRLSEEVRHGYKCHFYDAHDSKFTTEYSWQHCVGMHVGETYEIHWPHSAAGACGTPYQYQSPFYDGVFCKDGIISLDPLNTYTKIGVQGQVFTVVNDEDYFYPSLINGMIIDGEYGADVAKYTGSTTGTSRNNEICSRYTPITWQVDRKCHLISASSFDKMCADMKAQAADMHSDLHPHGARELVADEYAANNQQNRRL